MYKKIRVRLAEQDLSLADIARQCGLDYERLRKVASGLRNPRADELAALERLLRRPAEELFPPNVLRSATDVHDRSAVAPGAASS